MPLGTIVRNISYIFSQNRRGRVVSTDFCTLTNDCHRFYAAHRVEPFAVDFLKIADLVVNVTQAALVSVSRLEFNDSFLVVLAALFGAQDFKTVPCRVFSPVFSCLAVDFCNLLAFFA